jgi:2,3-bisphosphoglycerate-independent phosphoglycerate mutase
MNNALLIILDGWGVGAESPHNAITKGVAPFWHSLLETYPHATLHAKEESVGLSQGCLSGSEVGHTIIGAGRIVWQQASKIDADIASASFATHAVLADISQHLTQHGGALHLFGLLSDGGVHAHISHLYALCDWIIQHNITEASLHLCLDGRDMAPMSAQKLLEPLIEKYSDKISIATLAGRDLLDRNENWDKTTRLFSHLTSTPNLFTQHPLAYIDDYYAQGVSDEFIPPANFSTHCISDNDAVLFFNFRADRMKQLAKIFCNKAPHRIQSDLHIPKNLYIASMTEYGDELDQIHVLYPKEVPNNSLGEWISKKELRQLRIAESEKFAHVTYFFNGGREVTFDHETRLIIPSLGLSNYAPHPEMSLPELSNSLIRAIDSQQYNLIVCNIANGDMVGHSGDMDAAMQAVSHVDEALKSIITTAHTHHYTVIITADHGNIEYMRHDDEPHTAHTFNEVPLIITDPTIHIPPTGFLHQLAPTILDIMGIEKPSEMTSESLILI